MTHIDNVTENAKQAAAKLGIKKYDLYGTQTDKSSVSVNDGVTNQVEASHRQTLTVRVWNDAGLVGVTSTTDSSEPALEAALASAQEAAEFAAQDFAPDFSPLATENIAASKVKISPSAPISSLITTLLGAEADVKKTHSAIKGLPYNRIGQSVVERFYLNSVGVKRFDTWSVASLYLYASAQEEGKLTRSGDASRYSATAENLDVQGCIKESADKCLFHLKYKKIATGRYTVVFSPKAFLNILQSFSNIFNAQQVLDKQSLVTVESLQQKVSSSLLSISDDPTHPENIDKATFDGEGTPCRKLSLVEDGILKNFLQSSITAKRMGTKPTGHAHMGAKITVGAHYYHIAPGKNAVVPEKTYVYVDAVHALHAGINELQGSFSLPFDGWIIEGGTKTSLEGTTVAGDFLELLKTVAAVSPTSVVTPYGICPEITVPNLSITSQ